ncbi:MAG: FAD binding domain-containing protein, partial [Clostridia bacterium]|nr:FAD binding domain-containing protein [Clostridia bacterium]
IAFMRETTAVTPVFLAGGTDLMASKAHGIRREGCLIDLSGLHELRGVQEREDCIWIGAMTTFAAIERAPVVRLRLPALADAAARVGSTQIRNAATIGGNIGNMSPAADGTAALLALGAELELFKRREGAMRMNLEDYLRERTSGELEDALITGIRLSPGEREISAFVKLGSRTAVTISQLILAASMRIDGDDRITGARFVLGAIGRCCAADLETGAWAAGRGLDAEFADRLSMRLQQSVEKAISGRASMPYKRAAIIGLTEDIVNMLRSRAARVTK